MFDLAVNSLMRRLEAIIGLILAVMVVLVFGNVVLRYGFNSGITISEEASRYLFIWLTFIGAVIAILLRRRVLSGWTRATDNIPAAKVILHD